MADIEAVLVLAANVMLGYVLQHRPAVAALASS